MSAKSPTTSKVTTDPPYSDQIAYERLGRLFEKAAQRGISQKQVAERAGIPATYLSDVKRGQRPLGELFARRIGEQFGVDYRWLLGETGTMDSIPPPGAGPPPQESTSLWLPVFAHPVQGPPREIRQWDGSCVEVCGAAAARVRLAHHPYVLRFERDDHQGRLRQDDLLLISQQANAAAEIHVVCVRKRKKKDLFLARCVEGKWIRLFRGEAISGEVDRTGHCLGIVWGPLPTGAPVGNE